jgi:hypothetical protein
MLPKSTLKLTGRRSAHGHVRATKDLDVWVRPASDNAARAIAALRIDVMTTTDGIEFGEAWSGRLQAPFAHQTVPILSREHLIRNKRAAGHEQDLLDVKWLERNPPKQ